MMQLELQYQSFQMHEDLNIQYPAFIYCLLQKESETYSCSLTLTSTSTVTLYFYIASTFGVYMRESTNIRQISPGGTITLSFTFKSTNIISHIHQFVLISISSSKLSQLCSLPLSTKLRIQLKFTEDFVDDVLIEQIVSEESQYLLTEAENALKLNKITHARIKYQEAFQLLRKCGRALYGMALCSFQLKDWAASLRDIETALLFSPEDPHYQFLKIKALVLCYGSYKTWQGEIIEECFKALQLIQINKKNLLTQDQGSELVSLLQSIEQNPLLNRLRLLKKTVIARALDKYCEKVNVARFFSSKLELAKQLREILLCDEVEQNATPEEVIDPISYEIMSNPLILPSGHSFEQKTLQEYFQKNGFKDPIMRVETYPQWVLPNLNLRDFIQENPKLKIWRQYEYDLVYK